MRSRTSGSGPVRPACLGYGLTIETKSKRPETDLKPAKAVPRCADTRGLGRPLSSRRAWFGRRRPHPERPPRTPTGGRLPASTKRPSLPAERSRQPPAHKASTADPRPRPRPRGSNERIVQAVRYASHKKTTDTLGVGLRGWGSHTPAAWVSGLSVPEYLEKADVWPLNP